MSDTTENALGKSIAKNSLTLGLFAVLTDSASVQEAITAGDPDGSELIVRLTDPSDPMPPEGKGDMLPATDVQKIKNWIAAGAQF